MTMTENDFFAILWRAPGRALKAVGPLSFFESARSEAGDSLPARRVWLLHLGLAWLAGLPLLIALSLAAHFSSFTGFWSFLWAPARAQEPPFWIFLLGDARPGPLAFCATIGFLPALITRRSGWAWALAALGLFPGIFSIAGAWALVFGERLAIWVRACGCEPKAELRGDLVLRALIALVFFIFLLVFGNALRDWIQFTIAENPFDPEWRWLRWLAGLALLTAVETIASLIVFHFYFNLGLRRGPGL